LAVGADVQLQTTVSGLELDGGRVTAVRVRRQAGEESIPARQILSTVPITALARLARPAAPREVLDSAGALRFRAMLLVYLVLETEQFTEYDAHYFPDPEVGITRLSEPKNYGLAEVPGLTVLCAELPCFPEDPVWSADDAALGKLVEEALAAADLSVRAPVRQVAVRRLRQAYPVYLRQFREHFQRIDSWLSGLEGVLTFGRQGLFAHDNTHHALAMAYAAEQCLDDAGNLNRALWAEHRRAFEHHVVED
jgi:protoporphyrinogen oxidase